MPQKDYSEKTALFMEEDTASQLRDLAASLNFYITRGPGAGKVGNIKMLIEQVARRYQQSPEITRTAMQQLLHWQVNEAARPWMNLSCGHRWLAGGEEYPKTCPVCDDASGVIRPIVDFRRVDGDMYTAYRDKTIWGEMANEALACEARENTRES
jgi:hypothetical protein